jgi:ribosomal protein S27AE
MRYHEISGMKSKAHTLLSIRGDKNLKSRFSIKMEDRMDYEVKNVKMESEFKVCPTCGYKDGFHSMFNTEDDITRWLFICPSCHDVFDIGFTV